MPADYQDAFNYIIKTVESPHFQQQYSEGLTLARLNTIIESAMSYGNVPFPERICSKCYNFYKIDTIIEPVRICGRNHLTLKEENS